MKILPGLSCVVFPLLLCFAHAHTAQAAGQQDTNLDALNPKIQAFLQRPELSAYRGWIQYLRYQAEAAAAGTNPQTAFGGSARLADWLDRIRSNPEILGALRGTNEWAYESPADGSGQPFKINIPTNYSEARTWPMSVYLHGYSGNHLEHSAGMGPRADVFEIAVLGRARGGWYVGLSLADVLHVIDYVQAHWRIDPDRIHLKGGSMGGGGTLRLGARYPHRFASGFPTCGYGVDLPAANLLTFPIYATHSADDWTVPIVTARGPLTRLRQLGGQVVFDETNGFGHAVWNYAAGNQRGGNWENRQVRPDSRAIRRIDFTALDAAAARAWWAEIIEWGPKPEPARFLLVASADNTLHVELENVTQLRVRVQESPLDRTQPLRVSVGGGVPFELPPPLPDAMVLAQDSGNWRIQTNDARPRFPVHTPGGPILLYDGSPLLIVYGTTARHSEINGAMRAAAEAASKSPNPAWVGDGGEAGVDGVPHHQNLYGRLMVKADRDVTIDDIKRCNIVLIGTASQNSIARRFEEVLPVQLAGGKIVCSDGLELDATNRCFGLVHYSPMSPSRLLFWVGSEDISAYAASNPITIHAGRTLVGADFIVMEATGNRLVAARSFDNRWRWSPGRATSPLLPANLGTHEALANRTAEAIRLAAGADFGVAIPAAPAETAAFVPGTTRLSDRLLFSYQEPVGVFEVTGAELREINRLLTESSMNRSGIRLQPEPAELVEERAYRIAVSSPHVSRFASATKTATSEFQVTDLQTREALERFLVP